MRYDSALGGRGRLRGISRLAWLAVWPVLLTALPAVGQTLHDVSLASHELAHDLSQCAMVPPFWEHWSPGNVAVLALIAVAYGFVLLRLRRVQGQCDLLRSEVEARTFELTRLATTDPLTGIHNRRQFFELGGTEFKRAERFARALCLLVLDVDHFKRINDTFGHAVGDETLRAVVDGCRKVLRAIDLFGRIGGEEFAIVLPDTDGDGARKVAQRLCNALAELRVTAGDREVRLTVSVGVACRVTISEDLDTTLRRADAAMHEAKAGGGNRVVVAA